MKRLVLVLMVVALLATFVGTASAQYPYIQLFFINGKASSYCNYVGQVDSAFAVARNWNMMIQGCVFRVSYPMGVTWNSDEPAAGVVFVDGDTPSGISLFFNTPQNGYVPVTLCKVRYTCDEDCTMMHDAQLKVIDHPVIVPGIQCVRFPDFTEIGGYGMISIICPDLVPKEETSWGKVKALYGE